MAVVRRGLTPDQAEQPRVDLGRILVTIDDLQALLELLPESDPNRAEPVMEFEGGTFNDTDDIRSLSDRELARLTIKTDRVEIILGEDDAVVVGDEKLGAAIRNQWARQRRTSRRPSTSWLRLLGFVMMAVLIGFLAVMFGAALLMVLFRYDEFIEGSAQPDPGRGVMIAAVAIFFSLFLFVLVVPVRLIRELHRNCALVIPMKLAEYRQDRQLSSRHRQTLLIASAGVGGTLLGVIVTLLVRR